MKESMGGRRANGIGWKWSDVSSEDQIVAQLCAEAHQAKPLEGMPIVSGLTDIRLRRLLREAVDAALQLQANRTRKDIQDRQQARQNSSYERYVAPIVRRWRFLVCVVGLAFSFGVLTQNENIMFGLLFGGLTLFLASHGRSLPSLIRGPAAGEDKR